MIFTGGNPFVLTKGALALPSCLQVQEMVFQSKCTPAFWGKELAATLFENQFLLSVL